MRRAGGYGLSIYCDTGEVKEADSFTCRHCNRVKFVKPRERPEDLGGLCKVCMGLICADCVGQSCTPFEKKLEQQEAAYHARRSYER
jgi:hypothetical protein